MFVKKQNAVRIIIARVQRIDFFPLEFSSTKGSIYVSFVQKLQWGIKLIIKQAPKILLMHWSRPHYVRSAHYSSS
jgi:hypothetical protein